jgi:hypothetical protein
MTAAHLTMNIAKHSIDILYLHYDNICAYGHNKKCNVARVALHFINTIDILIFKKLNTR